MVIFCEGGESVEPFEVFMARQSTFEGLSTKTILFLITRLRIGAGGMGSLPYAIVGYLYSSIKKRAQILGYLTACFNEAAIMSY